MSKKIKNINNILSSGELNVKTFVGISDINFGGRKPKIYNLHWLSCKFNK